MHMLILNFLHQMQRNPPPAETTAPLLLRKQEHEMFLHSKIAKGNFPIQALWVILDINHTERWNSLDNTYVAFSTQFQANSYLKKSMWQELLLLELLQQAAMK